MTNKTKVKYIRPDIFPGPRNLLNNSSVERTLIVFVFLGGKTENVCFILIPLMITFFLATFDDG